MRTIERVGPLSDREFQRHFVASETPVILHGMIDAWPARQRWSREYFQRRYGPTPISVEVLQADRGSDTAYYLTSKTNTPMTIAQYLERVDGAQRDGRLYAAQLPLRTYLPDAASELGRFPYVWEWLARAAGFRELLWMGPAGCTSGLHFDGSHNFNVQIVGRRKWVIFPRIQQELLYVPSQLRLSYFSPIDYANPDFDKYPKYRDATPIEFEIEAGEMLFLPQGWVHCVTALEFSMAINLWWVTPQQAIERLPWFVKDRSAKKLAALPAWPTGPAGLAADAPAASKRKP